MSNRHKQIKRIRYYRRNNEKLDWFARRMGLDLCSFTGECDHEKRHRHKSVRQEARVWVKMLRGMDFTEADDYTCQDCLPAIYRNAMDETLSYNTRAGYTHFRHFLLYTIGESCG